MTQQLTTYSETKTDIITSTTSLGTNSAKSYYTKTYPIIYKLLINLHVTTKVMKSSLNCFVEHKNPCQTQYYKHTKLKIWKNMRVSMSGLI